MTQGLLTRAGHGNSADNVEFTTVRRPKFERPRTTYAFELRVVDGPDVGLSVTLDSASNTSVIVGQSSICAVQLTDAAVGSRHCSLQVVGAHLRIVDLSEPRSTLVNGTLVVEAMLSGGETLRVGDTALFINRVELRRDQSRATSFGRVRGESNAMRDLFPQLESATRSLEPVLIQGDRGVGKRLIAEELHRMTPRAGEPGLFVTLPSGFATPEESEKLLFGEAGLFEQAKGGTLYIGDVALLDEAAQHALGREMVLTAREREESRVRVIVASRAQGTPSLAPSLARHFAGAAGVRIAIPTLRARDADLVVLARHFWTELGGGGTLPDDFAMHFEGHAWPGNIRELRVVVQSWIQHGERTCGRSDMVPAAQQKLQDALSKVIESDLPFARARRQIVAEFEKRYVERALDRADHKISRAAAASGIAHRYFQVLKSRCMP